MPFRKTATRLAKNPHCNFILSAAKDPRICVKKYMRRSFAELTLSEAEGLRMTGSFFDIHSMKYILRIVFQPLRKAGTAE